MKAAEKLEDIKVGTTYRCCNYSIAFGEEWITPVAIDLTDRSITYENAARQKRSLSFKDKFEEREWFNFNNIHPA